MKIGDKVINGGNGTFIIAEVAQAHDGSLGLAHSFIDAVAETGADAIKFQTHIADAESTKDENFRVPMSGQDNTRWDYWKRMEFTKDQWHELYKHAKQKGLIFLSSPFSCEAFEILDGIGIPAWKIGSGEFYNSNLLNKIIETRKPILLSTGMATYNEIDEAYKIFKSFSVDFALFQCVSLYPAPLEKVGLNILNEFRDKYDCCLGLSDHSGTVFPSLAAMVQSVDIIEVHVVFDKRMYGPDTSSSITIEDLDFLVTANKSFTTLRKNPIKKDLTAKDLRTTRSIFTKSLCLINSLKAGEIIHTENLTLKKPGTGISVNERDKLVGKRVLCDVLADRLIKWSDIEVKNK
ncbi:N-acetylneuraminate synthase [Candidatus Methylopumilus rimovensis]|uniref:N-acetylneuraminate synthase n=1 Tax=Candidatus Methylopumilus rimovensis TaxID=2588535 RepID=A0AAE6FSV4_9PROT|nr:N-acetylneuraminate synthase family protein [Candidatus Methylopumilus rimovensis]QDD13359.1 N-acetylneuraminate synthase [Candidatus Methylopumilus rimovensis]